MSNSLFDIISRGLAEEAAKVIRRKCFVSYYAGDKVAVEKFLTDFGDVFIPKIIGVTDSDDFINSDDSDYVMSRIRELYLGDSTVTICLIGSCTHSRRYIDWELKATLRQGTYIPNGLLGIILPALGNSAHLPPRFKENWESDESQGYAMFRSYPTSKEQLRGWIEEAFERRINKANLIKNTQIIHKYSRSCNVHNQTH
jgi:hypothetical protein